MLLTKLIVDVNASVYLPYDIYMHCYFFLFGWLVMCNPLYVFLYEIGLELCESSWMIVIAKDHGEIQFVIHGFLVGKQNLSTVASGLCANVTDRVMDFQFASSGLIF